MKSLIFMTLMGCALAQYRPIPVASSGPRVAILKQNSEVNPDGSYSWSYEAENGIAAQEQGQQKNVPNSPEPGTEAQGQFHYTAPDGTPISLQYVANENGFQPQGAHLPVAPPIPEAIARALAWIQAHPEPQTVSGTGRRF